MNSKPSKSAKKREAQATDALATRLLALTAEQLGEVPLSEDLLGVVLATRKITARSALRRQRLYLAKQLRRIDCTEISAACEKFDRADRGEQRLFHQAEQWRDRLVMERRPALVEFSRLTGRDSKRLRQLVDKLGKNMPENRERQLGRDLFREIHAELSAVVHHDVAGV